MTDMSSGPGLDLDAIEKRWNAASPGPWRVSDAHGLCVMDRQGLMVVDLETASTPHNWRGQRENAEAVAAAPDDVATLVAALRAARAQGKRWHENWVQTINEKAEAQMERDAARATASGLERTVETLKQDVRDAYADRDAWVKDLRRERERAADAVSCLKGASAQRDAARERAHDLAAQNARLRYAACQVIGHLNAGNVEAARVAACDLTMVGVGAPVTVGGWSADELAAKLGRAEERARMMTEAVGLATTILPSLVMDPENPVAMMQEVVADVAKARADLDAFVSWALTVVHGAPAAEMVESLRAWREQLERSRDGWQRDCARETGNRDYWKERTERAESAVAQMRRALERVDRFICQANVAHHADQTWGDGETLAHSKEIRSALATDIGAGYMSPERHAEALVDAVRREKAIADVRVDRATAEARAQLAEVTGERRAAVALCTLQAPRLRANKERLEQAMALLVRAKLAAAAVIVPAQRHQDDVDAARALIADIIDYQRAALAEVT